MEDEMKMRNGSFLYNKYVQQLEKDTKKRKKKRGKHKIYLK